MRHTAAGSGLTEQQFDAARDQVRASIIGAAYDRRMTWNGEVAAQVGAVRIDPDSALMSHLLAAVFEAEYYAGLPALTSIVTARYGDKEPAPAFFAEARTLGYRFTEPYEFWTEQVHSVFAEHGRSERRHR